MWLFYGMWHFPAPGLLSRLGPRKARSCTDRSQGIVAESLDIFLRIKEGQALLNPPGALQLSGV